MIIWIVLAEIGIGCVLRALWEDKSVKVTILYVEIVFVVALCTVGYVVKGMYADLDAYLELNKLVSAETALLNEAKSGILKDTPEIQELSAELVVHLRKLDVLSDKAERAAKDWVFKLVYSEEVEEYWSTPNFVYEVSTELVSE